MATPDETTNGKTPTSASIASAGMKSALEDRSMFIRTMAKDMATLTGAPASVSAHPPAPEAISKNDETYSGVTLEKQKEPFFERLHAKSEDRLPETVALPSFDEAARIVGTGTPTPPIPAPPTEDRASILDRLRKNVGQDADMSIQQTPALLRTEVPSSKERGDGEIVSHIIPPTTSVTERPRTPVPATTVNSFERIGRDPIALVQPIETKAPPAARPWPGYTESAAIPERPVAVPSAAREPYREPVEPYVPPAASAPQTFHTYTSDFANKIDSSNASAFSVLAAEQDARVSTAQESSAPNKGRPLKVVFAVFTGVVLFALAGGGIFLTYQFVTTMRNTPIAAITVPSIVFADEYRKLEGTGSALMQALASASNGALVSGNVLVTYIIAEGGEGSGELLSAPAGGAVFLRALILPIPDILLRNIASESTVGIVNAGTQTRAFFALRVDSYERTYAGMLTWEPLMARDLALLYPLYPVEVVQAQELTSTTTSAVSGTSTASTSTTSKPIATPASATASTRFEDIIVANHDVRVLRDTNGKTLMLYGYADKRTLLIVRDEAAFEALLARLKSE